MEYRTDLALEYTEPTSQRVEKRKNCTITRIRENGADYITLEVPAISDHIDSGDELLHQLRDELSALLPGNGGWCSWRASGTGAITPDALGPQTAEQVLATRHIHGEIARITGLDGLRPVAVVSTGVLGCTGVETRELLTALAREFRPSAVIAVDALAARSLGRLGCTIQLSTGGISPGSGVNNARPQLSRETLGVPVIGIGVPTVVDAGTLAADLLGRAAPKDKVSPRGASMVVTPAGNRPAHHPRRPHGRHGDQHRAQPHPFRRGVFHPRKLSGKNRLSAIGLVCPFPLHLTFFSKHPPQGLDSHGPAYTLRSTAMVLRFKSCGKSV